MANPWAELNKHWNASGEAPAEYSLNAAPCWFRHDPEPPNGHLAGVWRGGEAGGEGEAAALPLLVELATDCKVADTWIDAK